MHPILDWLKLGYIYLVKFGDIYGDIHISGVPIIYSLKPFLLSTSLYDLYIKNVL